MISKHISLLETTKSSTAIRAGIDNNPSADVRLAMEFVANECFEPIREWYGKPIKVNSFFRSHELNVKVGGATDKNGNSTSQHVKGEAMDIDAGSKEENEKIFNWAKSNLEFDQLINEYDFSWVHISKKKKGNRKQILVVK